MNYFLEWYIMIDPQCLSITNMKLTGPTSFIEIWSNSNEIQWICPRLILIRHETNVEKQLLISRS